MNAQRPFTRNRLAPICRQRGVVLFIALIVMVAMSLAAVALIRSIDTGTQVVANLAFRQASIVLSNWAVERAAKGLFSQYGGPLVADITQDDLGENYYATHNQTWDDANGVPQPLQTLSNVGLAGLGQVFPPDQSGNTVHYVVERMCNPDPALTNPQRPDGSDPKLPKDSTTIGWCDVVNPKGGGMHESDRDKGFIFSPQAFYRVTVRVDGPKNTVTFVQTMLRPPGT
jgi:hypothetical protein